VRSHASSASFIYARRPVLLRKIRVLGKSERKCHLRGFAAVVRRLKRLVATSTMSPVRRMFIALLAAATMAACGGHKHDFAPLGPVTQADLWIQAGDGSSNIWKISDTKDLAHVVSFVDSKRTNWGTPWYGPPVPTVNVRFYDGEKFKGSFGVGKNFFATQRDGGFFSRNASPSEIRSFFDAVNLDDATLKEYTK
jgi:hypothetical protein